MSFPLTPHLVPTTYNWHHPHIPHLPRPLTPHPVPPTYNRPCPHTPVLLLQKVTNFTVNGNSAGAPCAPSWIYNGSSYSSCTTVNYTKPWCSTTSNYNNDRKWGECLDYDVCLNHSVLRDPWRNIGFDSASLPGGRRTDQNLVEGWYQLGGVGGDSLVLSCSNFSSTQSLSSILPNSTSPTNFQLYTCDSVYWSSSISCTQQNIHSLDCGQGWYLYYLVKTSGLYSTREYYHTLHVSIITLYT
ncbi:deleted in malignant brain tumors 1 protein-like [Astyanax mexicanus]|uniref:Deleted in malignant brain tumors 1 protein-like n=1 Tax=Astyanax mexicanus TaxID=7994 RepID=A0A8T2KVM0_ASTMX|nr:deleted in malignant brain tumors 1 protein-like [Astyanax mexicanus]